MLDEERPQVCQLPRTSQSQDEALQQRPSHDPRVDSLALISKLGLSFSLKDLLPPNILQPRVQISYFLHDLADLIFVRAFDLRCFANGHVEFEFDAADLRAAEEEARSCWDVGWCETEAVLAGIGGGEGEFAGGLAALGDDAVVVVENFVDSDEDALEIELEGPSVVKWVVKAYHFRVRLV